MPVDELEAMLPAVGVVLPPKATLKGGNLNLTMASAGPVDNLVTTGTIRLENTDSGQFRSGIETVRHLGAVRQEHRE